jgi:chloramphenicol-sensitive protein RarD
MSAPAAQGGSEARQALVAGVFCYLIWGWVPLYFQLLGRLGAGSWEIVGHRTVWAVPAALGLVLAARQGRRLMQVLRTPRTLAWLALSAVLIAINWLVYIHAVNTGRLLEGSLGYYINPLINMAAGAIVFRERMTRIGLAAIALATIGVVVQALALGHVPWIALVLAVTFGAYGIVRKRVDADAQSGLAVECMILAIPGAAFTLWLEASGGGHFQQSPLNALFLILSGPVTVLPLALFSWSARRMPLSVMGFLQFLGPTIGFGIGLAQGESFTPIRALSFAFIWAGAAVFIYGAWRAGRRVAVLAPA